MDKQYNPGLVEDKWYAAWTTNKYFRADENSAKPKYSIVIPPPNVTGILHMGHALNNTIQDILIRFKRMKGFEVLWMPGTDHAGIATQNVVEKKFAKEKKTRHDFGREAFVAEVWKWKEQYHATITSQLKKLGSSCDWDRERFTMDEGMSRAVRKVFVQLFNEGLIYRGKYIINWCPRCQTALSDEEAEHKESKGKLYYFKYPYKNGKGFMTVATTRPETMLGDTAVAVNPADDRYKALVGQMLVLPLVNRDIPVIADDFVDREFGTGAVKVTPAHDPNDFQMGLRHGMTPIVVMDEAGNMTGPIPQKYIGTDRFACRKQVVADLEALGLVDKIEDHVHAVGHCYRCHTVVEPYYSNQWFVKMKPLAKDALAAAVEDRVKFYPARWKKTYVDWMENIRDWCISRQIWWGHRIPVWYCKDCGKTIVAEETPASCPGCKSNNIVQDEDVLDTWFSSWLWPFSTMGWPEKTKLMDKFYPTDVLVTAPEILFFWVARMIMAGLHFTGKLPFTDVFLNATVRDKTGRKMSKSLGNAIDPLEVISKNGADSLRFSLIMITSQGADVFLANDTFDIGRNFGNKLWNASRFLLETIKERQSFAALPPVNELAPFDAWILSRLNATIAQVTSALSSYRLNEAAHSIYDFTWRDFCDWYIEAKKADLYQAADEKRAKNALNVCAWVLGSILKMLHPLMPFITEELWAALREKIEYPALLDSATIMRASFPAPDAAAVNEAVENEFTLLKDVITALRTIRSENNIPPDKKGRAIVIPGSSEAAGLLLPHVNEINMFCRLNETVVDATAKAPKFSGQAVVMGNQVYLELEGLIDKQVERDRISKEIAKTQKLADGTKARLENPSFADKAPPEVVKKEKEKYQGILENLDKLKKSLTALE
ncbi:MAG TPA: valine--tRNA ligase [Chitinivibrionales bacterium]|nr:valine--tRNA ligase [Chitinivibrionales bacterium]